MKLLAVGVALWLVNAPGETRLDEFDGAAAGGDWSYETLAARVADGALTVDDGFVVWRAVPYASAVTFSADLTITAAADRPNDWLTAGIAIHDDANNEWVMNLVQAPAAQQNRHYLELHERLAGVWLAQNEPGRQLPQLESRGGEFDWQVGVTYRLELRLTADSVVGTIRDGAAEVARFGWGLPAGATAVRAGRPAVRAAGLVARFDNARATVAATAAEPNRRPEFPAWAPRDGRPVARGTGYFATAEVDGRWWLVDPEGKPFFAVGTDHCRMSGHHCEQLGYAPYGRNMQAAHPSAAAWAAETSARLKDWNFNVVAAGHGPEIRYHGLPHILFASFGSRFARREWIAEPINWTGFPNVFSPDWPRHCELVAREIARDSRGDPWCLGIFLDNELEWYGKDGHLVREIYRRGPEHTAKQALLAFIVERYGGLATANQRLGTAWTSAPDFLARTDPPAANDEVTALHEAFLGVIAERYFSVACAAMRAADPDHLILGSRFAGQTPEPCLGPAGRHNDVFTINTYPRIDLATGRLERVQQQFTDDYAKVGKPFIITEWSFPALDSGLPCRHGAGMRVDTQAQKARCYEIFAQAMADLPFMVGYHYFMWVDEPALGISSTFPEDSNYGLVNEQGVPYEELVATARRVNAQAAERHARSVPYVEPAAEPAWREEMVNGARGDASSLRIDEGGAVWATRVGDGPLFARVAAGDLPLGEVTIAMHQILGGEHFWTSADRIEAIEPLGDHVWDVTVSYSGAGTPITAVDEAGTPAPASTGPPRFRAGLLVARLPGRPAISLQPLWVESLDARRWTLQDVFCFARPSIGGDSTDDELGGPGVPNYYLPSAFWTDPARGGAFGAATVGGSPWSVMFWKDEGGGFHPDARLEVAETLSPEDRWNAPPVPGLWIYALRQPDGWRELTAAAMRDGVALLLP